MAILKLYRKKAEFMPVFRVESNGALMAHIPASKLWLAKIKYKELAGLRKMPPKTKFIKVLDSNDADPMFFISRTDAFWNLADKAEKGRCKWGKGYKK